MKTNNKVKKKQKDTHISLMVIYNSQKKPLQFSVPILAIKGVLAFIAVFAIVVVYSVSSSWFLRKAIAENRNLQGDIHQLEANKQEMLDQNISLQQSLTERDMEIQHQESEIQQLAEYAEEASSGLAELQEKEREISEHLGVLDFTSYEATPSNAESEIVSEEPAVLNLSNTSPDIPLEVRYANINKYISDSKINMDKHLEFIKSDKFDMGVNRIKEQNLRNSIVEYARQFLGGPYVYGSNDPHTGVDCSGFTRYILANTAAVHLSRTAAAQSAQGRDVSIAEAQPGDLVFYAGAASVNHVALYIGNGRVIHASNSRNGIMESSWNYRQPVKIKNVISK